MKLICLTLLIISEITDSRAEQYEVVGPAGPVLAVAGEDVILPCSVKPSISVVDMRVEWFRLDLRDSQLVHLYEDHVDRNSDQIQSYRERTKLIHQELQRGNASLKLSSVRVSDEGLYKCFIQSKSWYDDTTLNVSVEAPPLKPTPKTRAKVVLSPFSFALRQKYITTKEGERKLCQRNCAFVPVPSSKMATPEETTKGVYVSSRDIFQKSGTSIEEHIQDIAGSAQPCLLALGRIIQFTSFDQHAIPSVGRPPVITVDGFDHSGGLHLQCESEGWNPEPDLEWLDSEGVSLSSETTEKHRNTDGFSVKHTVTVHERDGKIHCRFKLKHHMLETLIITTSNMFNSWRTSVIVISVFVVLGVIAGILIAVFAHKYREHIQLQNEYSQLQNEKRRIQQEFSLERDQLLQSLKRIIPKVNVILDADTAHPRLIVSDDGKQVRSGNTQTEGVYRGEDRFDEYLGVLGKEGFSLGCFYFEVQVTGQTKWDLGVARESADKGSIFLSPGDGYWIVGRRDGEYRARNSSDYSLSLRVAPQRVGVFVNYEKGLVSFYGVESSSHIYTFTDQSFNEKLYPFVSLGYERNEDSTPLIICDD